MELVSVYCFGEQLPDPDLVRKFIGYVIKDENKTEDFTPFDRQGIDVTPVVRSFILQQLLTIKGRYVYMQGSRIWVKVPIVNYYTPSFASWSKKPKRTPKYQFNVTIVGAFTNRIFCMIIGYVQLGRKFICTLCY